MFGRVHFQVKYCGFGTTNVPWSEVWVVYSTPVAFFTVTVALGTTPLAKPGRNVSSFDSLLLSVIWRTRGPSRSIESPNSWESERATLIEFQLRLFRQSPFKRPLAIQANAMPSLREQRRNDAGEEERSKSIVRTLYLLRDTNILMSTRRNSFVQVTKVSDRKADDPNSWTCERLLVSGATYSAIIRKLKQVPGKCNVRILIEVESGEPFVDRNKPPTLKNEILLHRADDRSE